MKTAKSSPKGQKTLREKEKLLVTSNFSFSHSDFQRLVLQTSKNQGLFGRGLTAGQSCLTSAKTIFEKKRLMYKVV